MLPMLFLAFAIPIITIAIMRSLRHASSLIANAPPHSYETGRPKPSDHYHDQTWLPLCTKVAAQAAIILSRPLTHEERKKIWRSRSELVLQVALKELQSTTNPQALIQSLPTGINRPDPTNWCENI